VEGEGVVLAQCGEKDLVGHVFVDVARILGGVATRHIGQRGNVGESLWHGQHAEHFG